jgi:hypothetical protein
VSPMPEAVRVRLHDDLDLAARAVKGRRADDAWVLLEEAHILSQPWAVAHVRVHWRMLTLAVRTGDRDEVAGQVIRLIVAGPGSLVGRYPVGNTGRSRVGLTDAMPLPPDVARLLDPDL